MVDDAHRVSIEAFPYFSSPTIYVATYSCGEYRSRKGSYIGFAERAARDHVMAKLGAAFDSDEFYRQIIYLRSQVKR